MYPYSQPLVDALWFRLLFGFLIGGVLGSFATMLAYRLPRKLSIVKPRSRCPSCQKVLGAPDLIPIFSWLYLKGRCRYCKASIGKQYLAIEIITALCCAFATLVLGLRPISILAYALIVSIIVSLSPPLHDKTIE